MTTIPTESPVTLDFFARDLGRYGDRIALIDGDSSLTYRELARRVTEAAATWQGRRRLALLSVRNTTESVITYLSLLVAGHAVILAPPGKPDTFTALATLYDPDIQVVEDRGQPEVRQLREHPAHDLHPELALLLSTSGSTGSAKLVRLSYTNLQSNAESIGDYLTITEADRAATSLPPYYCYGLSVIHSHLLRGASLLLTERSVTDREFWDEFRRHRATSFAGVPHTFELLDRIGFDRMSLPSLRYVTQAGGRLRPDDVRRYARHGESNGWDFVVMYGQTEATARMAYLPPGLAAEHPDCIGVAVPGGDLRLAAIPDWPTEDEGELIYTGPNVMMGYATGPADLGEEPSSAELRTGDVARLTSAGLYQIVGRRSRFLKLFGLRVDLQRVEDLLAEQGVTAYCTGDDERLVVAVQGLTTESALPQREAVTDFLAAECGLPARVVHVHLVAEVPRLPTGKPDYAAIIALADSSAVPVQPNDDLIALFQRVLNSPAITEDSSFASLGGDSMSYVEMSVRLENLLGELPHDWHVRTIRQLREIKRPRRRLRRVLETSVALRAASILLVVGTHAKLFDLPGGAHILLGVAGYNFGRFRASSPSRRQRAGRVAGSIARFVVPTVLWAALIHNLIGSYSWVNFVLANYVVGSDGSHHEWAFWFVDTLAYLLIAATALLSTRWGDRAERRFPFGLPMTLMLAGLVTRYDLLPGVDTSSRWVNDRVTPLTVAWLFALGWAMAKATKTWHRVLVVLAAITTVPGFFGDRSREVTIVLGLVALALLPTLPSIGPVNRVAKVLASASLYIYITHWVMLDQVTMRALAISPAAEPYLPILKVVFCVAFGIGFTYLAEATATGVARVWHRLRNTTRTPTADQVA